MSLFPWGLLAKGLAILAVLFACYWAWNHFVADPYIAEGVTKEKVNTDREALRANKAEAANKTLDADLSKLKIKVMDQNDSIAALTKAELAALAGKSEALAALDKERLSHVTELVRLKTAAATPSATSAIACYKATEELKELALTQRKEDQ